MKKIKDQQTKGPTIPSRIGVFVQVSVPNETSLQSNKRMQWTRRFAARH